MAHLLFDFGYRLVYLLQVDGSLLASPVETMTTAHIMGGLGLTRWLALSFDLPSNVSFTSASGVFLTATDPGGAVPEPASLALVGRFTRRR